MENFTNDQINKAFGRTFQKYRLKNNLTQKKTYWKTFEIKKNYFTIRNC